MSSEFINFGDISINTLGGDVYCNKEEISLTKTEVALLQYLIKNQERTVLREELLNNIWGYYKAIETRATDDVVKRLRKKLTLNNSIVYIDSVHGRGFKLRIKHTMNKKKKSLLEKFFSVNRSNNYTIESIKKELTNYLIEDFDIEINDAITICEVILDENIYNNQEKSSMLIIPIISRILKKPTEEWETIDLAFLAMVVGYMEPYMKTIRVTDTILEHSKLQEPIKAASLLNAILRLTRARYKEGNIDYDVLNSKFRIYLNKALELSRANNNETHEYVLLVRKGIFEKNHKDIEANLKELKKKNKEIYKLICDEVAEYSAYMGSSIGKILSWI
jgi:DNA-binding winged helix-turn-helix (wHTH) protein